MNFPGYDIARKIYEAYPEFSSTGDLDHMRIYVRMVAEQLCFSLNDHRYGVKSAGPTRPQGPSQIAYLSDNGELGGWRIVDGEGKRVEDILENPPYQLFTNQIFISVEPTNHLISIDKPPEPVPENNKTERVLQLLVQVRDSFNELIEIVKSLA